MRLDCRERFDKLPMLRIPAAQFPIQERRDSDLALRLVRRASPSVDFPLDRDVSWM